MTYNNGLTEIENFEIDKKKFNISAIRMFLTYSKVPESLTKELLLKQLKTKFVFKNYIIAEERHQDATKHFHVLLQSYKKFKINNSKSLDIHVDGQDFHGNYQPARNYKLVAQYIAKEKNYITDFNNFINGEFITVEDDLLRLSKQGMSTEEIAQYFLKNYTKQAFRGVSARNVTSLIDAAKTIFENKDKQDENKMNKDIINIELEDCQYPDALNDWIYRDFQPTLFLVGEAGRGKTLLVKLLAQKFKWNLLVVNHVEGLKMLNENHNAILFDDLTLTGFDDQQLLALIATDEEKQIRVLHTVVDKPKAMIQVVTLNMNVLKKMKKKFMHKQFARRIQIIVLDEDIYDFKNKKNKQINKHTQTYNNPQIIENTEKVLNDL